MCAARGQWWRTMISTPLVLSSRVYMLSVYSCAAGRTWFFFFFFYCTAPRKARFPWKRRKEKNYSIVAPHLFTRFFLFSFCRNPTSRAVIYTDIMTDRASHQTRISCCTTRACMCVYLRTPRQRITF